MEQGSGIRRPAKPPLAQFDPIFAKFSGITSVESGADKYTFTASNSKQAAHWAALVKPEIDTKGGSVAVEFEPMPARRAKSGDISADDFDKSYGNDFKSMPGVSGTSIELRPASGAGNKKTRQYIVTTQTQSDADALAAVFRKNVRGVEIKFETPSSGARLANYNHDYRQQARDRFPGFGG